MTARPSEALRKVGSDRIVAGAHDNGDVRHRMPGRSDRVIAPGHNQVALLGELLRENMHAHHDCYAMHFREAAEREALDGE